MLISRHAVNDFLHRDFDNHLWLKKATYEAIEYELARMRVRPRFKTKPWLHQLVCFYLGLRYPEFLFLLDMGCGKALQENELVLTPARGWRPIGKLQIGDPVIGADGRSTCVTGVFPQGFKPVFRVTFTDDVCVLCSDDHLWTVKTPNMKTWKTLPLSALRNDLRFPRSDNAKSSKGNLKWFVPMTEPVQFAEQKERSLHPYVLGVLIGNGCLGGGSCSFSLHHDDADIADRLQTLLPIGITVHAQSKVSAPTYSIRGNGGWLRRYLKKKRLNVKSRGKHIPREYLYAPITERIELLAGLLDTDGWAGEAGVFEWSTTSSLLAKQFTFLVHGLGGTARMWERCNEFGPYWRVYGRTPFNPFRSIRKSSRYDKGSLQPTRAIKSIEFVNEARCVCISVDNEDGLFLTRGAVVTHNSKIVMDLMTQYLREGKINRGLVTVPRLINIDSWRDDLAAHSDLEPHTVECENIEEKWERISNPKGDLTLIDYPGLTLALSKKNKRSGKLSPDEAKIEKVKRLYPFVGIDESHKLANDQSLWFMLMRRLTKDAAFTYAMTGTLFGRNVEHIWPQFFLVDKGETFGPNKGLLRAAFFDAEANKFGRGEKYTYRKGMDRALNRMLQHRSLRYDENEVHDLPERVNVPQRYEMTEEQREHYTRALEGLINAGHDDIEIKGAQWLRMRQIISGYLAWKDEHGSHVHHFARNPKLDGLERNLDEMGARNKAVISYEYTETGRMIVDRVRAMGIDCEWLWGGTKDKIACRRRFLEDKNCRVFVMNSEAGGTGNDGLQKVARYLFLYETPSPPITRQQVIKRISRPGQKMRSFIYDLIMQQSLDPGILADIAENRDTYESVVNGKRKPSKGFFLQNWAVDRVPN